MRNSSNDGFRIYPELTNKSKRKRIEAYNKYYNEFKELSLDELKTYYEANKPGGAKKLAILQIANELMAKLREKTMAEAAANIEPVIEEAKIIEETKGESTS